MSCAVIKSCFNDKRTYIKIIQLSIFQYKSKVVKMFIMVKLKKKKLKLCEKYSVISGFPIKTTDKNFIYILLENVYLTITLNRNVVNS